MVNNKHPLKVELYDGDEICQNKHPFRVKLVGGTEGLVTLGQVEAITGDLEDLKTVEKTNLVAAINELRTVLNGLLESQVKLQITNVEPSEGDELDDNTILGYHVGV